MGRSRRGRRKGGWRLGEEGFVPDVALYLIGRDGRIPRQRSLLCIPANGSDSCQAGSDSIEGRGTKVIMLELCSVLSPSTEYTRSMSDLFLLSPGLFFLSE